MPKQLAIIALLTASLAGCAKHMPTESTQSRQDQLPGSNGAAIEIVAQGGIAALASSHVVRHDDRYYLYTQRHLCTSGCAALDSTSGTLSASATEAMFNTVLAQSPFSLNDDYGATPNGADMMAYTVRLTIGGRTKTIKADDGTMPPQLHQIVNAVRETIAAARR